MVIMKLRDFFSRSLWKTKAIIRGKKVNSLEKRNKELIKSRDKTKIKNEKLRIKNIELEERITELKNEFKKN